MNVGLKLSELGTFRKAVRHAFWTGVATTAALAAAPVAAQQAATTSDKDDDATELETLEVTGSRLGRADIEGALPVATISREEIDKSGFISVGELLRNTTFNSLGAFRAQSGSSAQGLVAVDLRGLGSERTLVLIDGRRAPKAPYAPSAQDLNAVPLAIVERIEVLKDGASAIYGSDAIAGVINIITRKNYDGAMLSYQQGGTERAGGDTEGWNATAGFSGEKGSIVFGASGFSRDIIFARDSRFAEAGASFFSNNYILANFVDADNDGFDDNTGNYYYGAVPGGCPNSDPAYYITPSGICGYNFNAVAADEAATGNVGGFVRGNYKFTENWSLDIAGSVTRATSFGRYAPSLNDFAIVVPAASPNNPFGNQDIYLYHRFAALGTRDNNADANVYDLSGIFNGQVGDVKISTGMRNSEYQFYELGRNYVVLPIAEQFIIDGTYDIFDPSVSNSPDVLNSMKATINRDSIWDTKEYFAEANMPLFEMGGRSAAVGVGLEYRDEFYFDKYDSLQEAGAIGGSAGNSSGTTRKVKSAYFEFFMPVIDQLEFTLSGRFEDYNDVGENFAPKLSTRYQPLENITLRASVGQGFRAPTLDIISALPTFSAEAIDNDEATCNFAGGVWSNPGGPGNCSVQSQVTTIFISNPELQAEESDQFSVGFAMDITDDIDFSIDYYNISLTDRINEISPGEIIDRLGTGQPIPAGLGVTRNPNQQNRITLVTAGYANEGDLDTSGFDIEANSRVALGPVGELRTSFLMTYMLEYKIDSGQDLAGNETFPEYRATLGNTWTLGDLAVAINGNHIADQQNPGALPQARVPSYTTWDAQIAYTLPFLAGSELAVGALNVFNREPSPNSAFDGRDYNFYLYDQYGTQPYFKFTQKF